VRLHRDVGSFNGNRPQAGQGPQVQQA
jgi:hypothetical protein